MSTGPTTNAPLLRLDPGIPGGRSVPGYCDPARTYPGPVGQLIEEIEARGVRVAVAHDERDEPEWKSFEVFLPIMTAVGDGSLSVVLNVLSNVIYDRYVRSRAGRTNVDEPVVHYEVFEETVSDADGSVRRTRRVQVSKPASQGIEEIRRFLDGMS